MDGKTCRKFSCLLIFLQSRPCLSHQLALKNLNEAVNCLLARCPTIVGARRVNFCTASANKTFSWRGKLSRFLDNVDFFGIKQKMRDILVDVELRERRQSVVSRMTAGWF